MAMRAITGTDELELEEKLEVLAGEFLHAFRLQHRSEAREPAAKDTEERAAALEEHLALMRHTAELRKRLRAREESREDAILRANQADERSRALAVELRSVRDRDALLRNVPPHNDEAERAVLGALLVDAAMLKACGIEAADFYRAAHATIFEAMSRIAEAGEPVDLVTLVSELRTTGRLEEAGGPAEVAQLTQAAPSATNVVYYARLVKEKALLRRALEALALSQREIFESPEGADSLLRRIEARVFEVSGQRFRREPVHVKETVKEVLNGLKGDGK